MTTPLTKPIRKGDTVRYGARLIKCCVGLFWMYAVLVLVKAIAINYVEAKLQFF